MYLEHHPLRLSHEHQRLRIPLETNPLTRMFLEHQLSRIPLETSPLILCKVLVALVSRLHPLQGWAVVLCFERETLERLQCAVDPDQEPAT